MKRLLAVVLMLAPLAVPAAHAIEDRYDVPGVHDCWGIQPHRYECSR